MRDPDHDRSATVAIRTLLDSTSSTRLRPRTLSRRPAAGSREALLTGLVARSRVWYQDMVHRQCLLYLTDDLRNNAIIARFPRATCRTP